MSKFYILFDFWIGKYKNNELLEILVNNDLCKKYFGIRAWVYTVGSTNGLPPRCANPILEPKLSDVDLCTYAHTRTCIVHI